MAREVLIPAGRDPWVCVINQKVYSYAAGSVQTVPDEVAELADAMRRLEAKAERPGVIGQVLTRTEAGEEWEDIPDAESGEKGVIQKGAAVADATDETVVDQLNALIASLVASGVLAEYVAPTT